MGHDNIRTLYTMPGKVAGGGHLGTLEIMDRLRSYGFEPVALVNHKESDVTTLMRKYQIDCLFIPGYPGLLKRNIPQLLTQVFKFWRTIAKEKISLLHLSDMITGHYGILAARLAGIPSVLHMKSLYWTKEYGWPNKAVLSQASLILCISDAVHRACSESGLPRDKTITIHDGVDIENFSSKEDMGVKVRKDLGISKDKLVVGFVGRLGVEWKNEPLVYKLVGELSKQIEGLTLLVVGGPYDGKSDTFDKAKKLAIELGGATDIRFLGSRDDVPAILPAMDVYLVPSKEEPFGRVVIEGMAAGLPVVGSNNGGIPEMIIDGQSGFLRSPEDLDSGVTIVKRLLEKPELRKQIGKNARERVEEHFTLDEMIQKVAREYFRLLNSKASRAAETQMSHVN
ncbi:MAG: glycosyltransferase family 4 protein [Candidatus Sifarchaeia archaeon]|jgi:glycosyltransferase involved in cell wall biosynthesis